MYTKYIIGALLLFIGCLSCNQTKNKITNKNDYQRYLDLKNNELLNSAHEDYIFWNQKLEKSPNQYPYLSKISNANIQLFETTGKIEYLIAAEKNLVEANTKTNYSNSGLLRALARNYITQHRFKESLVLLQKAEEYGEHLKATQNMLFDVYLELGDNEKAKQYLSIIKGNNDFDYLIRNSKWSDHIGNLIDAIKYMEKALLKAESSKNVSILQWTYTNLGDFYGHAGRIEDAYHSYLKALALNSNNVYALKNIAWIVYSYEHNSEEALLILDSISKKHYSPDYYLLKAEIAEFNNNFLEKEKNLQAYLKAIENKNYGEMYNKFNALLFTEELQNIDKALRIAEREINQRPTPQSYDLLAWTLYKKGEVIKAIKVMENHVLNRSFEPEILYHLAVIYKANGKEKETKELKNELLESTFELGPNMEQKIKLL